MVPNIKEENVKDEKTARSITPFYPWRSYIQIPDEKNHVNAIQEGGVCLTKSKPPTQDYKNLEQNDGILLPIAQRQE